MAYFGLERAFYEVISIFYRPGSVEVEAGVGFTGEQNPETVSQVLSTPVEDSFADLIPGTLEVTFIQSSTTTEGGDVTTAEDIGVTEDPGVEEQTEEPYAECVTPSSCSNRGQYVTDIYTRCTVCDCRPGFFGDMCEEGSVFLFQFPAVV